MERYFLGIDIGTFASRGILIDESFRVTADASVPHGMDNPQPGWFEQDAEAVWWGDLCKLCRTLIEQSGIRPEQIACVGTSADRTLWTGAGAGAVRPSHLFRRHGHKDPLAAAA